MDIYSAIKAGDKLLEFTVKFEPPTNMYQPTRMRLKHLASACDSAISQIESILGESNLCNSPPQDVTDCVSQAYHIQKCVAQLADFDGDMSQNTITNLHHLSTLCGNIQSLISTALGNIVDESQFLTTPVKHGEALSIIQYLRSCGIVPKDAVSPEIPPISPDSQSSTSPDVSTLDSSTARISNAATSAVEPLQSVHDSDDSAEITASPPAFTSTSSKSVDKGQVLAIYRDSFNKALHTDQDCPQVRECLKFIDKWLHIRFFNKDPEFKYKLDQLPQWVAAFIIAYAKNQEDRTMMEFEKDLNAWFDKVQRGGCKYAIPPNVYKIMTSKDPDDFLLTACVLADMICDLLPPEFSYLKLRNYFFRASIVVIKVTNMNPAVHKTYRYYKEDSTVFSDIRVTRTDHFEIGDLI